MPEAVRIRHERFCACLISFLWTPGRAIAARPSAYHSSGRAIAARSSAYHSSARAIAARSSAYHSSARAIAARSSAYHSSARAYSQSRADALPGASRLPLLIKKGAPSVAGSLGKPVQARFSHETADWLNCGAEFLKKVVDSPKGLVVEYMMHYCGVVGLFG